MNVKLYRFLCKEAGVSDEEMLLGLRKYAYEVNPKGFLEKQAWAWTPFFVGSGGVGALTHFFGDGGEAEKLREELRTVKNTLQKERLRERYPNIGRLAGAGMVGGAGLGALAGPVLFDSIPETQARLVGAVGGGILGSATGLAVSDYLNNKE